MPRKAQNVQDDYTIDRATLYVIYISMASIGISVLVHLSDLPGFAIQYTWFLCFDLAIIPTTRLGFVKIKATQEIKWDKIGWWVLITIGLTLATQAIIGLISKTKFALLPWEIYLFYVNAAIAEETLFRITLIPFLDTLLSKMPFFNMQHVFRKITLIVSTAAVFSLSHYWVYGSEPLQMISAFVAGLIFALGFIQAKNPLPAISAHVFNNVIASFKIVQSMSIMVPRLLKILSVIIK